ncbi:hypothetical protein HYU23_04550 [Candidatus Woesearchaeota archaeon]|nr:hypothetical protein [Candidatus Woesearchaeota archaeon]
MKAKYYVNFLKKINNLESLISKYNKIYVAATYGILSLIVLHSFVMLSKLLFKFPIDYFTDLTSYLARADFLARYGYFTYIIDWYSGYYVLKYYSPLWFFIEVWFNALFNNYLLSAFIIAILSIIILFLVIYKSSFFNTKSKAILFFLISLANFGSFRYFFMLGRFPVLLSFIFLVPLIFILFIYYDKKLDWRFSISYVLLTSFATMSHISAFVVVSPLLAGFFLVNKQRIKFAFLTILSIAVNWFWIKDFIILDKNVMIAVSGDTALGLTLSFTIANIRHYIVSLFFILILLILYFSYRKDKKKKNLFLFLLPIFGFSIFYLTKLLLYVPIFNNVYNDYYEIVLWLVAFVLILKYDLLNKRRILKFTIFALSVLFLCGAIYSIIVYNDYNFKYSEKAKNVITLSNYLSDKDVLFIYNSPKSGTVGGTVVSYYNMEKHVKSVDGWFDQGALKQQIDYLRSLRSSMKNEQCDTFNNLLLQENVNKVLSLGGKSSCLNSKRLISCKGDFCLYEV